jgi:hypothetical protein
MVDALTGVSHDEWAFLFALVVALLLTVRGSVDVRRTGGSTTGSPAVLLTGILLLAIALITLGERLPNLASRVVGRAWAMAVLVGVVILAMSLVEFALGQARRGVTTVLRHGHLPDRVTRIVALATSLTLLAVIVSGGLSVAGHSDDSVEQATPLELDDGARLLASFAMPGSVMDVEMLGPRDGYLSIAEGRIMRFRIADDIDRGIDLTSVATTEGQPRGLAIIGQHLFVGELIGLPCPPDERICDGATLDESPQQGELEILGSATGRVLSYFMEPDGTLSDRRTVIDDLPVVSSLHGVNGMDGGPDGYLYVSIGALDHLWKTPGAIEGLETPNLDLLGTVIRVAPEGGQIDVFAEGLRNVYGLEFDDRGDLYGVDNDGPTVRGWRREAVLQIGRGDNYGYPSTGPLDESIRAAVPPIWFLDDIGSAGLTPRDRFGLSPGLLIGTCGSVWSIRFGARAADPIVRRPPHRLVELIPGCVTAIELGPGQTALVGVFAGGAEPHPLLLIDLGEVR